MAAIHLRIFGYLTTLVLHITNLTVMEMMKKDELSAEIGIKIFRRMTYRYFTTWTVGLQIIYAALGLYCDVLILKNAQKKNYSIWKPLKGLRNVMFAAIVWPCTMPSPCQGRLKQCLRSIEIQLITQNIINAVSIVFWTVFLYDRNLIFPEFIDKVISTTSNHILHTAIVPIAVWEILFRPRSPPKSHLRNLFHLAVHLIVYLVVLYYTYIQDGIWLYPMFEDTFGSIYFYLVHAYVGGISLMFYYIQWLLSYAVHGSQREKSKIK